MRPKNEPPKETAPRPAEEKKSDLKKTKERRIQNTKWERLLEKVQMSKIPNGHRIRHQP